MAIMKIARYQWDIVVILPKNSKPDFLAFLDALDIRYEFLARPFDPKDATTLVQKLKRQLQRVRSEIDTFNFLRRYDLAESVLHIEIAPWQSWILLSALALRGSNTFVTLHNFRPEIPRWRMFVWKLRFQIVSRLPGFHIFASNKDTRLQLKGWVTARFWETIQVTYTCIDPEQIEAVLDQAVDQLELRRRFDVPLDKFVVLAVGQFIDRKGRWVFLDAIKRLGEIRSDIVFVWLMPEPINTADNDRIQAMNLRGSFVPVISEKVGKDRLSILRFFKIADAFALPSFVEGLPIAILEAMALRLPVIATDVYAIPEAVKPGETGILIPSGDVDALCRAVRKLKEDKGLRDHLAMGGSRYVIDNFDERVAARISVKSYEECFGSTSI